MTRLACIRVKSKNVCLSLFQTHQIEKLKIITQFEKDKIV